MKRPILGSLAFACTAALLSACGGGGTSATPATPQNQVTPNDQASSYLTLLYGRGDSNKVSNETTIYAYSEQNPAPIVTLQATGIDESSRYMATYAWDANTFSIKGKSSLIYLDHGTIKRISLKKSDAQTPVQISNITDACRLVDYSGGGPDGLDVLISVGRSGKAGDCSSGVKSMSYIRSTANASAAPIGFPADSQVITSFDDLDGNVLGYLVITGGLVKIYSPDLSKSNVVSGSTGITSMSEQAILLDGKTMFATNGKSLYRISLGANTTASMSAVHTTASSGTAVFDFRGMADTTNVYYCDGTSLFSAGSTGAETLMGTISGNCTDVQTGPSGILVGTDDDTDSLWFAPYGGTQAKSLGVHTGQAVIYGTTQSKAYYTLAGSGMGTLKSVGLDGTGETTISARNGSYAYGHTTPVYKNFLLGRPSLSALIYFDLPANVGDDGKADLIQLNLSNDSKVKLGTFNLNQPYMQAYAYLFDGQPWSFIAYGRNTGSVDSTTDLWFITQGQANSLRSASGFLK